MSTSTSVQQKSGKKQVATFAVYLLPINSVACVGPKQYEKIIESGRLDFEGSKDSFGDQELEWNQIFVVFDSANTLLLPGQANFCEKLFVYASLWWYIMCTRFYEFYCLWTPISSHFDP